MPVLVVPIVLNKAGVTFSNASDWFRDVETQIIAWRGVVVAIVTLVGFGLVAQSTHSSARPP